jgi:hypothetical protein
MASSFETHRFAILRMRSQTLMVRSASSRVSNHETRGFILRDASLSDAPQDEVFFPDEVCQTLMVRSAAAPRVSNHEASGEATMTREKRQ